MGPVLNFHTTKAVAGRENTLGDRITGVTTVKLVIRGSVVIILHARRNTNVLATAKAKCSNAAGRKMTAEMVNELNGRHTILPLMIMKYETILLDLGGVLIDVDYHAAARAFTAFGFRDFEALYSKAQQDHLFDGFETGDLSPSEFRERIRGLHNVPISDEQIDASWNAMLGSVPSERLDLVKRLKEHYQVLLLSNTNAIHVPAFERILDRENGVTDFKSLFHGAYYSCEMHLRKPHPAAFHHVLNAHHADPARTLFIDDSIQHVEGARKAGLHAEFLDLSKEDVIGMVNRLGLVG